MKYNEMIDSIMPLVNERDQSTPFIISRQNDEWVVNYPFPPETASEFYKNVLEKDPFALTLIGSDFAFGSFPYVYDDVLCQRLSKEYMFDSSADKDKLGAISCFFDDNAASFSQHTMDYLVSMDRPLATLREMLPFDMTHSYEYWQYNEDLAETAIDHIEKAVHERLNPEINAPSHGADVNDSAPQKRNIEGYEEKLCIHLARRYVVLAENPAAEKPYLVCNIRWDNLLGIETGYNKVISDSYLEAMREFTNRTGDLITALETERKESGLPFQTLNETHCVQRRHNTDWTDRLIVIKPQSLAPEYRSAEHQLAICTGGFGASSDARGSAVYIQELFSGKEYRYDRHQIAGEADLSKMPEWARVQMALRQTAVESDFLGHNKPPVQAKPPKSKKSLLEKLDNAKETARQAEAKKSVQVEKIKKRSERE